MNKIAYLYRRQTGKTTLSVYEATKDLDNTLIVKSNIRSADSLKKQYKHINLNVTTYDDVLNHMTGKSAPTTIILDDYDIYKNNMNVSQYINNLIHLHPNTLKNLIMFVDLDNYLEYQTTYANLISFVTKNKQYKYSLEGCIHTYISNTDSKIGGIDDLINMYYSFLTDVDIKIFKFEDRIFSHVR
jgi:hypothetical protein